MKQASILVLVAGFLMSVASTASSQVKWNVGGNMGMSIVTSPSSADFTFGPNAEVLFGKGMAVGTEFNIFTGTGTPIEWANYFKYYIAVSGSKLKPYVNAGFGLLFVTGGPYFDIRFGGGVGFPVAKKLYIGPDLQLGPVFATGNTRFVILIRGGLRYEI